MSEYQKGSGEPQTRINKGQSPTCTTASIGTADALTGAMQFKPITSFPPTELIRFVMQLRDMKIWFENYWECISDRHDCIDFAIVDLECKLYEVTKIISKAVVFEFQNFYYYSDRNQLIDEHKKQ